jgi:hypothetical protein
VTDNRALRRITGKKDKKDENYIMRNIVFTLKLKQQMQGLQSCSWPTNQLIQNFDLDTLMST